MDAGSGGSAQQRQRQRRYDSDEDDIVPGTDDRTGMELGAGGCCRGGVCAHVRVRARNGGCSACRGWRPLAHWALLTHSTLTPCPFNPSPVNPSEPEGHEA